MSWLSCIWTITSTQPLCIKKSCHIEL
jgi:hypothetical protein